MAAAKIIVVEKNEGEKIAYDVSTTKIIFGDDDLMVNIKNRERDEEVTLAIMRNLPVLCILPLLPWRPRYTQS